MLLATVLPVSDEQFRSTGTVDVFFSPTGGATDAIVRELDSAKSEILVQAYSFTSKPIAKALLDAKKRGVKVVVVLDKSQRREKYTSADFVAHAGVPTFIDDEHAIAHNKIVIIDRQTLITGSFNFTKAAEEKNAENLLVMKGNRPLVDQGCRTMYIKILAANDNSKQQVYLGGDFTAINVIPVESVTPDPARPHIFKAPLNFWWLTDDGTAHRARHSKLILYPQYPEVRFSGFLRGCPAAPSELIGEQSRLAARILFFGICPDRKVIGYICHPDSELAHEVVAQEDLPRTGVFLELGLGILPADERSLLIEKLREIYLMGWIRSHKLGATGAEMPCEAPNCGGFTLEAKLGIIPNSKSEPDYLGYEVKQYGVTNLGRIAVGVLTLMTPEPTSGYYRTAGVEAFIRKFGYADLTGRAGREDRLNFGGIHKVGNYHDRTKLAIVLKGFEAGKITDATGGISLMNREGEEAAVWGYAEIMAHWNRKHNKAVYIPSQCDLSPARRYRYGNLIRIGDGTDFVKYLQAMEDGKVYYDPGIKLEGASSASPTTKRRSQFRIKSADVPSLYNTMETFDLSCP